MPPKLKEYVFLVGLANCVAWPVAYFLMRKWLQEFAYRTSSGIWIFLTAGFVTLVFAVMTVSYQAVRAAVTNPVGSLRSE
ncbi:MAG: hypothetical protein PVF22_09105 [Candidatus Aminicenantes bacterium]|jgi:putative ABC transport system permease protein